MSPRAFVIAVGVLLVVLGAVGLVLHRLNVFQTCTRGVSIYGPEQVCSQSPAVLILSIVLLVIGLISALGAIVIDGAR